ncbi:aspartate carbamoyltransferase [Chloroflexota bacterium]
MVKEKRNLVTIDDMSNDEIESLFLLADEMYKALDKQSNTCSGRIMATLFYEPSTRTRLSFESAMLRLGGSVISSANMDSSSAVKGESLADTIRVVSGYADIIVLRHPLEGAAKVAADYARVPVINAGDGGHEHPTQTLCDLYTLRKEKGTIKGLTVALWGDLKYGRTIHSLSYALARFGADIISIPVEGLEMPDHVTDKLRSEYNYYIETARFDDIPSMMGKVDAVYMNPSRPHQLSLLQAEKLSSSQIHNPKKETNIDALYLTRVQKERHPTNESADKSYSRIDLKALRGPRLKDTLVMHPLPRVDELPYEVDEEPRSIYFKQAAYGVPVRMALTAFLLGIKNINIPEEVLSPAPIMDYPLYKRDTGIRCSNLNCISTHETTYIKPEFKIVSIGPLVLRCVYCDCEQYPSYIASSEWHQGTLENKRCHSASSHLIHKIKPENLLIFNSQSEAEAYGFKPGKF